MVIDAIRATTSMVFALEAGAEAIHVFAEIDLCRSAASRHGGRCVLAGERLGAPIEGFDLGNGPQEYTPAAVRGSTLFMTTTNGTRAILAAEGAAEVLIGAFVNRRALGAYIIQRNCDVTFLCAGQHGERASEDELAAHAFYPLLRPRITGGWPPTPGELRWVHDERYVDSEIFEQRLQETLPLTTGGATLIRHGYGHTLERCAWVDRLSVVGRAQGAVVERKAEKSASDGFL